MPDQVSETIGFIMINRSLFKHPFWKERRTFSKCEAWLDMIRQARFEQSEATELINGKLLRWGRGELVASVRFLADRWDWGKSKAAEFMKLLEDQQMIRRRVEQGETIVTLLNYQNYNPPESLSIGSSKKTKKNGQANGQQNKPQALISDDPPDSEADRGRTGGGQGADKTNKENKENKDSTPPCAWRYSHDGFFDRQLEANKDHPDIDKYRHLVDFLHGLNGSPLKFENILSLPKQISFLDYLALKETEKKSDRTIKAVLQSMENKTTLKKEYSSVYLTADNWLQNNFKK